MIGSRAGAGAFGSAGRVGLLLGLVVILAAHLAGTVHGAAFEGPHLDMVVAVAHHDAYDDRGGHPSPHPEHDHEHEADGHADHAADRPGTRRPTASPSTRDLANFPRT
ncbi:hypothetical protein PV726_36125 [Streptomyces europaeiscabiei]|uniref:hypothetical protein n=1 Tax=Streptomyces europaeiscabiei TaxID=146819 RepID=UPI0029B015C2|nr:hypothetical protein [Streptomyces europaeiscabiei]MDX3695658.1 hypothetical protein [Streptomyces europaeiscabiei]